METIVHLFEKIYYWIFPPPPLPIFHIGDRVRVFSRKTGEILCIGKVTKLSYPGDEFRRFLRDTYGEIMTKYDPGPPYVSVYVENDGEENVYFHPTKQRVELLPEDKPQEKGDNTPGKYD